MFTMATDEGGASAPTPAPTATANGIEPYIILKKRNQQVVYDVMKYLRRSNRLKGYDYSRPGAYFVTMCLYGREPYLEIPAVRAIAEGTWNALPQRFPTIYLDEFVVMSDHVHFILWLRPDAYNRPPLSRIVGAYKSLTARAALAHLRTLGDICGDHFWQRDFYDHIITHKAELHEIRHYICENPYKPCGEVSTRYEGGVHTHPKSQ